MRTAGTKVLIALLALLMLQGCKDGKSTKKNEADKGPVWKGSFTIHPLVAKDLTSIGFAGMTITVPKNVTLEKAMKISKSDPDVAAINNSEGFSIWIFQKKVDLAKEQLRIQNSSLRKFKGWVSKKPDSLIYRTVDLVGKDALRFVVAMSAGGKHYTCKVMGGVSFSKRSLIDQMITACKSLKKK